MNEIIELKLIDFLSLSIEYPNDIEFGKNCRQMFQIVEVNRDFPNDHDLGKYVRKYLQKLQK